MTLSLDQRTLLRIVDAGHQVAAPRRDEFLASVADRLQQLHPTDQQVADAIQAALRDHGRQAA